MHTNHQRPDHFMTRGRLAPTLFVLLTTAAAHAVDVERVIPTTPFLTASTTSMSDGEGMAYVPQDDMLWLADDNSDRIYAVDRGTGVLTHIIDQAEFALAIELGGVEPAGLERTEDFESIAYSAADDTLYVVSGNCCPGPPTMFRLTRGVGTDFVVESHQRLPQTANYGGAAVHPDGTLYVSKGGDIAPFDYVANLEGATIEINGMTGSVDGLGFNPAGTELFTVTSSNTLFRVTWATATVRTGCTISMTDLGILDPRAVNLIEGKVYVLDGQSPEHDLTVLDAPCECEPADVNQDGTVNFTDLLAVITAWGACN